MQAMILAAGMGKRLKDLTQDATKCMVRVCGETMIERMLRMLDRKGLSRIVVVIGYEGQKLREYIGTLGIKTPVEYVSNDVYDKTNNIYSLFLARTALLEDDTLLLESDLVFEEALVDRLLSDPYPTLALVDRFESWMDGTVVTLDGQGGIKRFISKREFRFEDVGEYYKTVNIYKFSRAFSETHYVPFLEAYIRAQGQNEYYEQVLKVITRLDRPEIRALALSGERWYEIDDVQDLDIAESMFVTDGAERTRRVSERAGGYWRYPSMLDFSTPKHPAFPSEKLFSELAANFGRLAVSRPSSARVCRLLAAKNLSLHAQQVAVAQSPEALLSALFADEQRPVVSVHGALGEVTGVRVVPFRSKEADLGYRVEQLVSACREAGAGALVLANPDALTGRARQTEELSSLAEQLSALGARLVVDETFSDFAPAGSEGLLRAGRLCEHENAYVLRSAEAEGVSGLSFAVLACADTQTVSALCARLPQTPLSATAEFYLQIAEKYKGDFTASVGTAAHLRQSLLRALMTVPFLRPVDTDSLAVLCEVTGARRADELVTRLLCEHNILIEDVCHKAGGQYVRIAVRTEAEHRALLAALTAEA